MLLVFGSLNADMLFTVDTLPRPGETVLCPGYQLAAGGKGANQAAAAAKAGGDVHMVGHLGEDSFGAFARQVMTEAGVDCRRVETSKKATAIAVIGVDRSAENQIIVASGANLDTHPDQVKPADLGSNVTVLCQNEIRPRSSFELLRRAKASGARTLLNQAPAAGLSQDMAKTVDILIVNSLEAAVVAGESAMGDDPLAFATALSRTLDLTVVITLGSEGAVAAEPAGRGRFKISSLSITPVDTTGAGDTFVGVFAATLDQGGDLPSALQHGSVAAGLACTGLGAQTSQPSAAEIRARLAEVVVEDVG